MPRKPKAAPASGGDGGSGSSAGAREPKRVKHSFTVRRDLLDEVRGAAEHLAGHPVFLTLSQLVETALENELVRLRKAHHGGKPFAPPRSRRASADE